MNTNVYSLVSIVIYNNYAYEEFAYRYSKDTMHFWKSSLCSISRLN